MIKPTPLQRCASNDSFHVLLHSKFLLDLLLLVPDLGMISHSLVWKCLGQLCYNALPKKLFEITFAKSQKFSSKHSNRS